MYQQWWKIISIWLTVLEIKSPVITRSVLWRYGWLLTNRGQLRWIDERNMKWRRHRFHWWWKLIAIGVIALGIKAMVVMRSRSLPTLIFPCSTFLATTNTIWAWHDECNMSLWWCCVPVVLFVDGQQKARANFLAKQLQSYLSFSTRNKIDYEIFVSI